MRKPMIVLFERFYADTWRMKAVDNVIGIEYRRGDKTGIGMLGLQRRLRTNGRDVTWFESWDNVAHIRVEHERRRS